MPKPTVMNVNIEGPGELIIGAVDRTGTLLFRKRIVLSGDPSVYGIAQIPLTLTTIEGEVPVVPVLIRQAQRGQRIAFEGRKPADFTQRRSRELKVPRGLVERAIRSEAATRDPYGGLFLSTLPADVRPWRPSRRR